MSAFHGMDTLQVRDHARRLQQRSGDLLELRGRLEATVRSATWEGRDAAAFRTGWEQLAGSHLEALGAELTALGDRVVAEADAQDEASAGGQGGDGSGGRDGGGQDPDGSGLPPATTGEGTGRGYLHEDNPWLPDGLEHAAESWDSGLAGTASDALGRGLDGGIDVLESGLGGLGVETGGIAQCQRDADHLGGVGEDWATGERVPTVAELGAAALLTAGSAGVGVYEAVTGEDTPFLDDRPGGIVTAVRTDTGPQQGPQTLQDLVVGNDALRPGGAAALEAGQIGVQEVRPAGGGDPVYIVQVPPTEGAGITEVPEAYGGQGNSRDWGSNLRLVAGQDPAAMDDVRAAMAAADVPAGAQIMIVGHSQGGIVASHLAADPAFNNATGAAGTYDVTHTFSVGSPVQTVVPAQGSTQTVNVNHASSVDDGGFGGDLIAGTDLQGLQPGGGHLTAPNRHEVTLDPYPGTDWNPVPVLKRNHDSVGPGHDGDLGYAGSVGRSTASDPTLSALQRDLSGRYLGDGTEVVSSTVVTVGRGAP